MSDQQLSLLDITLDDATSRRLGLQRTREVKRPRLPLNEGRTKSLVKTLAPSARPTSGPPAPQPLVDVPRAANADPHTSHLAAERIAKSGALGEQQAIVLDVVRNFPGSTSAELADAIAKARGEDYAEWRTRVARRLPELAVLHVKRGSARIFKVNATMAITWWPV